MSRRSGISRKTGPRGQALVVVLTLTTIMTALVAAAILYSGMDERSTAKNIHNTSMQDMTEASLQFARSFFTQNFTTWGTYLAYFTTTHTTAQILAAHPELFPTFTTGTPYTCYIYARDDVDELPPATNNPSVDNNLRIFVGAVCSLTNPPKTLVNPQPAEMSAPLEYNPSQSQCQAQFSGGTQGLNNCSTPIGYR